MKSLFSLFLLTFLFSSLHAQDKTAAGRISGTVTDESAKALDYATVSLLKAQDSSLVKANVSSASGTFSFENLPMGSYLVSVVMTGYGKYRSAPITLSPERTTAALAPIGLSPQAKALREITLATTKPLIERKMDKLVMNVESSTLAAGNTAMELLEKAPGVTVDKDDNISMKGKKGVMIMLDGKQTYMSNADVANLLRNMQSSQIESIELITSPSSKYDAAGTSGIINIKTRKSKSVGANGSLTAGGGYGLTSKANGGAVLNYRNAHANFFGNYSFASNGRKNMLDLNRTVRYDDTTTRFTQLNDWENRRYNNSYKVGADYFLSKNHTVGVLVNGYRNNSDEHSTSNTSWINDRSQQESIAISGNNNQRYNNTAVNVNYKGVLDGKSKELSADADYSNYKGVLDELRDNAYTAVNIATRSPLQVKNYAPTDISVKSFKVDYSQPLTKTSKMEAGIKTSLVKTDNDLLLARLSGTTYVPDPEYTNHFIYDENINAAYLNFSTEWKKTGVQIGLRAEDTRSKGNSVTKNDVVKRHYLEFFPSLSLSQKLGKDHELGLSYSRRIDRPSYDDLNPFLNFLDEYTFSKGNPFLNPQFTNSVDFSHTYKGTITTSLGYSHTTDAMTTVTEQDDVTKKTFAIQRNLDEQNVYSLSVYAPVPVTKWWNVTNNIQVFRIDFKSTSNGGTLNAGQTAMTYNLDQSFTFSKTAGADFSGQYQSPMLYGIFKIKSQLVFNAGLRKSLYNNRLNIRVNMNDLFNGRKQRISTTYQNMDLHFIEKQESQIGRVTISYRFGKNEVKPSRKRATGLEDEQKRMKN